MTRTVLWIDDQPSQAFVNRADSKFQINIAVRKTYEDGIEWLKNHKDICDAVILDVNCKIRSEKEAPSMNVFTDYAYQVYKLCENDRFIPWFVYTAGGYEGEESLRRAVPTTEWSKKNYYSKPSEHDQLLHNIVDATLNADNVAIRKRYKEAFAICDDYMDGLLLTVAKVIEEGNTCNTNIFNCMRKLVAKSVEFCKVHGLLPDDIYTATQTKNFLRAINQADPVEEIIPSEIVPSYISWNYSACWDCVNNGSHAEGEEKDPDKPNLFVDKDVSNGDAPYLGRATFYQLLTLFTWMGHLPYDEAGKDSLKEKIAKLRQAPVQGELDEIVDILEKKTQKDNPNRSDYFVAQHKLRFSEALLTWEGKPIRINDCLELRNGKPIPVDKYELIEDY